MKTTFDMIWPDIFTTWDENREPAALCADALCAWGNCMAGSKPPANFGEVMVKIGKKLGISPASDSFMAWAKANVPDKKESA